ncbi:MAG TPA: cytochrome c [Verrucomicrobiae bacterium]|nr:cytochrome c [Verrucomicrobiae bacterium]
MNQLTSSPNAWLARLGAAAVAAALYATPSCFVQASDTEKPADTKVAQAKTDKKEAVKPKKEEKKKLTGAELYSIHCNRCHPERYPTEWTAAQWKTLMLHMRVRANVPADQAKAISKYLQEEAGN